MDFAFGALITSPIHGLDHVGDVPNPTGLTFWRAAEIQSHQWFVLEKWTRTEDVPIRQQWFLTHVELVSDLMGCGEAISSRLMAFLPFPSSSTGTNLFGEVQELFLSPSSGKVFVRFVDGLTMLYHGGEQPSDAADQDVLQMVYERLITGKNPHPASEWLRPTASKLGHSA